MQLVHSPEAEIRRRIHESGPITFAEFMEVALYWPRGGYYSTANIETSPFGPAGDYYTSPMVHPAFGSLLSVQLYQFWLLLQRPNPFHVVEVGAGNGQLARDILSAARRLPEGFPDSLQYLCLDRSPSGDRRSNREQVLTGILTEALPFRNLQGCILSNELIDSFPVHQVRVEKGELREVYISEETGSDGFGGPLVEQLGEPSTPALAQRLEDLGVVLAEGQTAEINLRLDAWSDSASAALESGFVLTIDYGRPADELYSAELRPRGTLTTFHRHVQTDSPLRNIGSQDITAQVDFTSLVNAGRRSGLEPLGYTTQAEFLRNLHLDSLRRRVTSTPLPVNQAVANRSGILALTRPEGLGNFKVLVQGKNLPSFSTSRPSLWGLTAASEALAVLDALPVPLLTDSHISLPEGWGQPAMQEFELTDLWSGPFGDTEGAASD